MNKIYENLVPALLTIAVIGVSSFGQGSEEGKGQLTGAWEYVGPATVDCVTRGPNGPNVHVSLLFNQGGTMFVEDTFPLEGPYRTTGPGIWKRETTGEFSYAHMHYSFAPDNTFLWTIKQRSRLRLSRDGESYTEQGTFKAVAPDGTVLFTGCFGGTANRVIF